MFCSQCGFKNAEGAKFCMQCGQQISSSAQTRPPTENTEKTVIECSRCGHKLRIPVLDKQIQVTCPSCQNTFSHPGTTAFPPPPKTTAMASQGGGKKPSTKSSSDNIGIRLLGLLWMGGGIYFCSLDIRLGFKIMGLVAIVNGIRVMATGKM